MSQTGASSNAAPQPPPKIRRDAGTYANDLDIPTPEIKDKKAKIAFFKEQSEKNRMTWSDFKKGFIPCLRQRKFLQMLLAPTLDWLNKPNPAIPTKNAELSVLEADKFDKVSKGSFGAFRLEMLIEIQKCIS